MNISLVRIKDFLFGVGWLAKPASHDYDPPWQPKFHCLLLLATGVYIVQTAEYSNVCDPFIYITNKNVYYLSCWTLHCCVCESYGMENEFLTQFVLDGFQDAVWIAQHAGCCRADLNEVFSHGLTQEHGVKCCYFINSHWGNFQHLCNLNLNKYRHCIGLLKG